MFEIGNHLEKRHSKAAAPPPEFLAAENVSLRLLLAQAEIDAQELLGQAGSTPRSARRLSNFRS
jgi:hypothetical protein